MAAGVDDDDSKLQSFLQRIGTRQDNRSDLRGSMSSPPPPRQELPTVGSSEDREPSDVEVQSAIWEVCGDHGSLGLLVDLLRVKIAELEEGTGTEASDSQLLETLYSSDLEDSLSGSDENKKSRINYRSCIVYRRGQKQLTRLFLREAEHLQELSANEQN